MAERDAAMGERDAAQGGKRKLADADDGAAPASRVKAEDDAAEDVNEEDGEGQEGPALGTVFMCPPEGVVDLLGALGKLHLPLLSLTGDVGLFLGAMRGAHTLLQQPGGDGLIRWGYYSVACDAVATGRADNLLIAARGPADHAPVARQARQ